MTTKTILLWSTTVVVVLVTAMIVWWRWLSPTHIAFVNYQAIALSEIYKSNDNPMIAISELKVDELDRLSHYDMVFINAMGLRITHEQRTLILKAADKGLPILTTAATNPDNDINSIDSIVETTLNNYIINGGRKNYRSLLNYVRKFVDRKMIYAIEPEALAMRDNSILYHFDPTNRDNDDLGFQSVAQYNNFLHANGLFTSSAPQIIITGQMGNPTDLAAQLEATGNNVYVVRDMKRFVSEHHIDSINPSAIINMAHGRMGDYIVNYLQQHNIPLFTTLNVNKKQADWENDKMGMNGGFLSQSIVTPEIDGAIRPFVLFAHRLNADGIEEVYAIPERLETFVHTVNNYIALQHKSNSDKRVAIYYYKAPGQSALTAAGMEVTPSLFNLLSAMKQAGYNVEGLPHSSKEFEKLLQAQGAVFSTYHRGAFDEFLQHGSPLIIDKTEYESWITSSIPSTMYADVVNRYGEFPGSFMSIDPQHLGLARLQLGNIVLIPQMMSAEGDNSFAIVHGTDDAPPHPYIASYLWTQMDFKADALVHFGTHGSLEFTPRKQVALSNNDWADRLIGCLPHFYIYSIDDVGEGMIAKRRSYATLQSHLTPPFMESKVRETYRQLTDAIKTYHRLSNDQSSKQLDNAALAVKQWTVKLGIHRELGLDSTLTTPYSADEIARLESFVDELANAKITGQLYTMGLPYEVERITSTIYAMATDPIAYSLFALDKQRHRVDFDINKNKTRFTQQYLEPARNIVTNLLTNPHLATDKYVCRIANISMQELDEAKTIEQNTQMPQDMMQRMALLATRMQNAPQQQTDTARPTMSQHSDKTNPKIALKMAKLMGATPEQLKKMEAAMGHNPQDTNSKTPNNHQPVAPSTYQQYTKEQRDKAHAIVEVERAIMNIGNYYRQLLESPSAEITSFLNALNGGYTWPSSGGDPITNPNVLPTGRNLYAINAENTPSEAAWEKGVDLANNTIEMYRQHHNDSLPRKVSYTLWSGEFIESEGATIAQILYMLGIEPIWDTFGRVTDLRLIPSHELGRPRIDIVVQTSGQLRDLAASRLFLINKAVEMAAAANDKAFTNQVQEGVIEAERLLIDKGLSPKAAREASYFRIFGGVNGNYGTGIQGMVQASDRWDNEQQLAEVYLNNMGAFYGDEQKWEQVQRWAFEAALTRTDAVIQPRQSNTWGALSLDHVYEFMGGLNLTVRNVTGKDPDAYLSDYRNHNNMRMQEVKEAIGVESRTTILNPTYIKEKMKGEATSANSFNEIIQNTFGWNVMKPNVIDNALWNDIYNVYIEDQYQLNIQSFFEEQNPAALQDITATMLETARKGMWKANEQQLQQLAQLHTELVDKYGLSGSYASTNNEKLQQFIAEHVNPTTAKRYQQQIVDAKQLDNSTDKGIVMQKEQLNNTSDAQQSTINNTIIGIVVAALIIALILWVYRRRKRNNDDNQHHKTT